LEFLGEIRMARRRTTRWYLPTYTISKSTYNRVRRITGATSITRHRAFSSVRYRIRDWYKTLAIWDVYGKHIESYTEKCKTLRKTPCPSESDLPVILKQERNKKIWEF